MFGGGEWRSHSKYTGYNWSIYCRDYVQLVATESNVLLYLSPTSVRLFCLLQESLSEWSWMTAVLYYTVPQIAARVDVSWNGIFWDHSIVFINQIWLSHFMQRMFRRAWYMADRRYKVDWKFSGCKFNSNSIECHLYPYL